MQKYKKLQLGVLIYTEVLPLKEAPRLGGRPLRKYPLTPPRPIAGVRLGLASTFCAWL